MDSGLQVVQPAIHSGEFVVHTESRASSVSRPSTPAVRFAFVDGLRGLAALAIVVFHIWWYEPEPNFALESAHWVVDAAFLRVRGGVQVLLVISGFVIAYTLRKTWITPSEIFSFIGRRLIRLVPAYWVAIATVILVDAACRTLGGLSSPFEGKLSLVRVTAHLCIPAGRFWTRSTRCWHVDAVYRDAVLFRRCHWLGALPAIETRKFGQRSPTVTRRVIAGVRTRRIHLAISLAVARDE